MSPSRRLAAKACDRSLSHLTLVAAAAFASYAIVPRPADAPRDVHFLRSSRADLVPFAFVTEQECVRPPNPHADAHDECLEQTRPPQNRRYKATEGGYAQAWVATPASKLVATRPLRCLGCVQLFAMAALASASFARGSLSRRRTPLPSWG